MAVRVRLTRVGAKKNAMWRVVVADQRSPRDGRFIEMIGHYNPQSQPSQIVIDRERLDHWIGQGAQPTATVKKLMRAEMTPATATVSSPQHVASTEPETAPEADASTEPEAAPEADASTEPEAKAAPEADAKSDGGADADAAPGDDAETAADDATGDAAAEAAAPDDAKSS
ncbi:MAG: 30S ribosomal protein S16 [Thermoleophilaceae bacterium]